MRASEGPASGKSAHDAIGPDRNAWVLSPHAVDRVTSLGAVAAFAAPAGVEFGGAIARGRDGALWFLGVEPSTQYGNAPANAIFRLTTAGACYSAVYRLSLAGTILKQFVLPGASNPEAIAMGPGRELWVTLDGSNAIARIKPSGRPFSYAHW